MSGGLCDSPLELKFIHKTSVISMSRRGNVGGEKEKS